MKRVLFLLSAASLVLTAGGDIKNTKHNLSASGMQYSGGAASTETQLCKFCHTPHGSQAYMVGGGAKFVSLWGHDTTQATYNGETVTANNGGGSTFACLSCHDGTVAINANTSVYDGVSATSDKRETALGAMNTLTGLIEGGMLVSGQKGVTNSNHPVNKLYKDVTYPTRYVANATASAQGIRFFSGTTVTTDKYIQCSSCHAVHGGEIATATPGLYDNAMLLRVTTNGSALCFACHLK